MAEVTPAAAGQDRAGDAERLREPAAVDGARAAEGGEGEPLAGS